MEKELKRVPLSELKPYKNNPRINDKAVEAVKKSIKQCGYVAPIIVDENMVILAGHTRYSAIVDGGGTDAEVLVCYGMSEEQKKKYRLLDNKTNELAKWDFEKLVEELDVLDFGDLDLDWGVDFDGMIEEQQTAVEDECQEVDEDAEPKTKRGEIYQLGSHRLMCGDSTSADDVRALLDGNIADLVFTDPPYGMKKEKDGVANDNLNYDDLLEFNKQWIPITFEVLKDTGCWYCWGIDEPLMDIYSHILKPLKAENKIAIRNYITWAKHSARGINSAGALSYPRETEKCWFVMKGRNWNNNKAEFFNEKYTKILEYMQGEAEKVGLTSKKVTEITGVQMFCHWFSKSQFTIIPENHYKKLQNEYKNAFLMPYAQLKKMIGTQGDPCEQLKPYFDSHKYDDQGDIGLTDVWRIMQTNNEERESAGGHATPKPIVLCSRAIMASTREGESVLDVFGGSGSTMIACEQTHRRSFLMELEPKWCDVIIERWEKFTGEKAVRIREARED